MKINKFALGLCLCLSLCGCKGEVYKETTDFNITAYTQTDDVIDSEAEYVLKNFEKTMQPLASKQKKELEKNFNKVEGVSYVQYSNGREVSVFESKRVRGIYVLTDTEWTYPILPYSIRLKGCDELYERLEDTAFIPYSNECGENGAGIIRCENKEYTLSDYECVTPFSVKYKDVDVFTDKLPMQALVYVNGGRAERVELVSAVSDDISALTDENIADVRLLFDKLGFGEESAALANELAESLSKGGYYRSDGALSVRSSKNVKRIGDIVFNVFCVDLR